ncbi:unnamed protein product, partial [Urochloa humidicola]
IQQFPRRSVPPDIFFFWFSVSTPGTPRPLLPIDSSIAPLPGQAAEGRRRPEAPSSSQYGSACRWLRLNGQSAADLRRRCHLGATRPEAPLFACGTPTAGARKSCRWIEYRLSGKRYCWVAYYILIRMLCSIVERVESPLVLTPPSNVEEGVEIWLALRSECLVIH